MRVIFPVLELIVTLDHIIYEAYKYWYVDYSKQKVVKIRFLGTYLSDITGDKIFINDVYCIVMCPRE